MNPSNTTARRSDVVFNSDLAERVLAQIKDHPGTWDQTVYRCETGMCFAGWAIQLEGVEWRNWSGNDEMTVAGPPARVAAGLLGLGEWEDDRARALFESLNDLDTIERLVKHFANNPDDDSLPLSAVSDDR